MLFLMRSALFLATLLALCTGCASRPVSDTGFARPFQFERDTFAFANELVWEYIHDENGDWSARRREPKPDYTLRCFVLTRSVRQFFQHARFVPDAPRVDHDTYRSLIQQVVGTDPARVWPEDDRVLIPGYRNLREFSRAHEDLLKEECGGAWRSYVQRGHWRLVFPFSRRHQEDMAGSLVEALNRNRPPVVHLIRFPNLSINHALLLFTCEDDGDVIRFSAYDPNHPEEPVPLIYSRSTRTFTFPVNDYFRGGEVNVYEVYRSWIL
jgi:hypothetical protein